MGTPQAIQIRVGSMQVRLIRKAAKLERKTVAAFVREAALAAAAERVVRNQSLTAVGAMHG